MHHLRFEVTGTTIRARTWPDGGSEPTSWNVEATDASVSAAGDFRVEYFKISSARGARVDDLVLSGS